VPLSPFEPADFAGRLSIKEKSTKMAWLIGLSVLVLAVLAGSPGLLAHRAERYRRLHFAKRRRMRLRAR